jgi:uncharacterized membrane protein YebE (DUF533 family)
VESQVIRVAKRSATNQARRIASQLLRKALGGGIFGQMSSTILNTATTASKIGQGYTDEETHAAALEAFKKVQHYFFYDATAKKWIPASKADISTNAQKSANLSELDKKIAANPITSRFDKEILARLLVEVANADGNISADEKTFLQNFVSPSLGTVEKILSADPLTPMECEEVSSAGVKESIYILAWVVSLIDLDIDTSELSLLEDFADIFAFSPALKNDLIYKAKAHVLELNIHLDSTREDVLSVAKLLQMPENDALRTHIQLKKRN